MDQTIHAKRKNLIYILDPIKKTAAVASNENASGVVKIPKTIKYQDQIFVVTRIKEGAFANSQKIRSITFPFDSSVSIIEKDAFLNSSIQNLFIPASISELLEGWCRGTPMLTEITIMPNNPKYIYLDGACILGKSDQNCQIYNNLVFAKRKIENIIIPSFVTQIKSYAFSECSIEKVFIPSHVKQICEGSFYKCKFLKQVEIPSDSELESIESLSFFGTLIESILIPSSICSLGKNWCNESSKISTSIKPPVESSFQNRNSLIKDGKCLRYQRKEGPFTKAILKSTRQHKKIEIFPEGKEQFSLHDFILFSYATYPLFITGNIEKSTVKNISFTLTSLPNVKDLKIDNEKKSKDRIYAIHVEISNDYNIIHVYIKDFLNCFPKEDGMIAFQIKDFKYEIFDKILVKQDPVSMLHVFGKYVANKQVKSPIFLKYTFSRFQSIRTREYKSKFAQTDNIIKMLSSVPGKILFRYQKPGAGGYTFKLKDKGDITVQSIAWLFPWAQEVIEKIHYLQIDGSFKAFPDYAFCLWHGIYFNETVPFAFTLFPTESFQLYNLLFECLKLYHIDENLFKGRIVLSDMGEAIDLFCRTYNMPKLVCHRHLIERFGANSPLGIIVRRLLKVTNETKYLQMSKEIDAELKLYIKYKQEYSTLDEKTLNKINNIKIMISGTNANSNSNYYVYKWAQWLRTDYHVGRCTNHAEGAHGNINSSMERRGATNFSSGLSTTINYILNFFKIERITMEHHLQIDI